jgi:nitroreductase
MSIEIDRLLARHTVREFTEEKLPQELIDNALKIAAKTPTSLNSRPVRIFEISEHMKEEWINHQVPVQNAPHLFALTFSSELAEKHIREKFSEKFGCTVDDEKVEKMLDASVRASGDHYAELQLYLVAGYFSATLEAQGATGCWIRGFDRDIAKKELQLEGDETAGLLFAAGFEKK